MELLLSSLVVEGREKALGMVSCLVVCCLLFSLETFGFGYQNTTKSESIVDCWFLVLGGLRGHIKTMLQILQSNTNK
jgi:hypothetical protein